MKYKTKYLFEKAVELSKLLEGKTVEAIRISDDKLRTEIRNFLLKTNYSFVTERDVTSSTTTIEIRHHAKKYPDLRWSLGTKVVEHGKCGETVHLVKFDYEGEPRLMFLSPSMFKILLEPTTENPGRKELTAITAPAPGHLAQIDRELQTDKIAIDDPSVPNLSYVYCEEVICGSSIAASCGAPIDTRYVSALDFVKRPGLTYTDFLVHKPDDVDLMFLIARDRGELRVKPAYRLCAKCKAK